MKNFAKKYHLNINEERLLLETDDEVITLKIGPQYKYRFCENNLLRFINPELCDGVEITDKCFWPTHKEHEYLDSIVEREEYDEYDEYDDFFEDEIITIEYKDRSKYSTSFFKVYSNEDKLTEKAILDIKKQIYAMRKYGCVKGNLPAGYGVLQMAGKDKTENPRTRHCNFWKISSKHNVSALFSNIMTNFEPVVPNCKKELSDYNVKNNYEKDRV